MVLKPRKLLLLGTVAASARPFVPHEPWCPGSTSSNSADDEPVCCASKCGIACGCDFAERRHPQWSRICCPQLARRAKTQCSAGALNSTESCVLKGGPSFGEVPLLLDNTLLNSTSRDIPRLLWQTHSSRANVPQEAVAAIETFGRGYEVSAERGIYLQCLL